MLDLATATLRTQTRRFVAPIVAIALGVAFVAASLVLGGTLSRGVAASVSNDIGSYAAVLTSSGGSPSLPASVAARAKRVPGVTEVTSTRMEPAMARTGATERYILLTTPPATGSAARVTEGRLPRTDAEVAVSLSAQARTGARLGGHLGIAPLEAGSAREVRIVGLVDAGADAQYAGSMPAVFATGSGVARLSGHDVLTAVFVTSSDSGVVERLATTFGDTVRVETGSAYAARLVRQVTGGTDFISAILLGFATIALFASALVIGNTYAILSSRRMRESALLRCIGSTRGDLLRANVIEAAVIGLIGSAVGVALGVALAAIAVALAGDNQAIPMAGLAVSPAAIVVPLVTGVVVTVLACLRPAWRATRVAPVAALRPDLPVSASSRAGRLRIASGFLLIAVGVALIVIAAIGPSLIAGLAGGTLSFLGVLMAASVIVPALLAAIGRLVARPFGVPGELAVENAIRNPGRAAATTSALLVGVTLISTLVVGSATTLRSITHLLDEEYPIDIAVARQEGALPAATVDALMSMADVALAAPLRTVTLRLPGIDPLRASEITDTARSVSRSPGDLARPAAGDVVVSSSFATRHRLRDGQRLPARAGDPSLTVRIAPTLGYDALVAPETVDAVDPGAGVGSVWLRLRAGAQAGDANDRVQATVRDLSGAEVVSGVSGRDRITRVLDIMVLVASALLGVAVLIALVGIGNTLSLSVIERTRENGLLRALGLTARQLRGTLAVEAVLIAVVGALLGVGLGTAYGISGAYALMGTDVHVVPAVPVTRLAVILMVALVAGLLASVLPARQAAKVPPSAALAAD